MTEAEFLDASDAVFDRIEDALDHAAIDADIDRQGNVLQIGFDDGGKVIVNRHLPNREIWLAARSGGYHYRWQDDGWRDTRGEGELFERLAALVRELSGVSPRFD